MAIFRVIPAGDMALVDGSPVLIGGLDYVRQTIAARFKFFLGEWFRDRRLGVPYYRVILRRNPNMDAVRSVFRQVLVGSPGVVEVTRFDVVLNRSKRTLSFDFEVRCDEGVLTVSSLDAPFILRY